MPRTAQTDEIGISFSEESKEKIEELVSRYPDPASAAQGTLHIAQEEFGEINEDVQRLVAETLGISRIRVYELVRFYETLWEGKVPEKRFEVCTGLSCEMAGSEELVEELCDHYDVNEGEIREDREVLVREMQCLAGCESAPYMLVNNRAYMDVDREDLEEIIEEVEREDWEPNFDTQPPQKRPEPAERVLTARMHRDDSHTIEGYEEEDGYEAARDALHHMTREEVRQEVEDAGVEGRGGAGFPAGVKWKFIPDPDAVDDPIYLTVNCDEAEPGTCKDRMIIEEDPHMLIEGIILCCYAVGSHQSYIYTRGEFGKGFQRLKAALEEAYEAGYLGEDIFDSGYDLDVYPHFAGGAYICGEETAMLESLEGKKALPRNRPPFPAQAGLYGCPTVVNNVETLSNVPFIIKNGAEWYHELSGDPENPGTRLFCVSGDVREPGVYELPITTNARDLIYDVAGGIRDGNELKALIPGGASSPVLTPDEIDVQMDFSSLDEAGTMAGSGGVMVVDDTRCAVRVLLNIEHFFHDESCGQCTPCREGTGWMEKIIRRIENGNGRKKDLDLLQNMTGRISGRVICALAEGAVGPLQSFVEKYRDEFVRHIEEGTCPLEMDT